MCVCGPFVHSCERLLTYASLVQILDRKELRWLDVSTKDSAHPSARKGAAVPSSNPNEEDRHVITAYGQMPGKRAGHTSTAVDRRIFVFGGSCGPEYLSDFFVLDTDPPPEVVVRTKSCIKSMETNLEKWFNDEVRFKTLISPCCLRSLPQCVSCVCPPLTAPPPRRSSPT